MIAAAPSVLVDAGAAAGALVAIGMLAAGLSRLRPVRWLWRTVVAAPVSRWFRAEVCEEMRTALVPIQEEQAHLRRDLVAHMAAEEDLRRADERDRIEQRGRLDARLRAIEAQLSAGAARFDGLDERMGRIERAVTRTGGEGL